MTVACIAAGNAVDIFSLCHRIIRVRLRFQQSNLQQKDSVYIEFADAAGANAAIADPPLQLGSTSNRFECMHKEDYAQQQQSFPQTSSLATSTGKRKQGSADTVADNAADLTANKEKSIKRKKLEVAQAKEIDELQAALKQEQAQNAQLKEGSKQVGLLAAYLQKHYWKTKFLNVTLSKD